MPNDIFKATSQASRLDWTRMILVKICTGKKNSAGILAQNRYVHDFIPSSELIFTPGTDENPDYSAPLSDLSVD